MVLPRRVLDDLDDELLSIIYILNINNDYLLDELENPYGVFLGKLPDKLGNSGVFVVSKSHSSTIGPILGLLRPNELELNDNAGPLLGECLNAILTGGLAAARRIILANPAEPNEPDELDERLERREPRDALDAGRLERVRLSLLRLRLRRRVDLLDELDELIYIITKYN
jgi:hypothetical protein